MDAVKLRKIEKLAVELENFKDCYSDCEICANRDGTIDSEDLIIWLTDNPHMMDIAQIIKRIEKEI